MWDENVDEVAIETALTTRTPIDIDSLNDGRCRASSWRTALPARPTYENHFGPGGYNRCIGSKDHVNSLHKDEWGFVFKIGDDGTFRVVRHEEPIV